MGNLWIADNNGLSDKTRELKSISEMPIHGRAINLNREQLANKKHKPALLFHKPRKLTFRIAFTAWNFPSMNHTPTEHLKVR